MSLRDVIKDLLYVSSKDDFSKRYLSTQNPNYQYIISINEKNKFDSSKLIEENIIQEFTFSDILYSGEGDTKCSISKFSFSNISIGSTHIREVHEFDLKTISKLCVLELLMRSNMGLDLYKSINQNEDTSKLFDFCSILNRDKEFASLDIKTPFVVAMIIERIYTEGLEIEGIFRKCVNEASFKELNHELLGFLSNDVNNIDKVYALLQNQETQMLASVLKNFLRNIGLIIPTNVVKLLIGVPDINEPEKVVLFYQCLLLQIPEPKRSLLEIILDMLSKLVEKVDKNKIDLYNAAVLFAQVLFSVVDVESNKFIIRVLQQMIHYRRLIFLVPRNVIKVYKNDNELNKVNFEPVRCIGRKTHKDWLDSSVTLCNFKHSLDGDSCQDQVDCPRVKENTITYKYKKQSKVFSFHDSSTVADLLKTTDESVSASQLKLVENNGNLYQCSLHPETKVCKVIENSSSGYFTALPVSETDIVKSTMEDLRIFLGISRS